MLTALDPALLARLEALRLSVHHFRWGSLLGGRFLVNRRGSSIEFADYLAYNPGDDIRSIDWNLYARLDRLFIKTYKEEVELAVEILVDATASMELPTAQKFERACELALCLAYVGLAGRHGVRMSWMTPGPPTVGPRCFQRAELTRLTEQARRIKPGGHVTLSEWMAPAIAALRIRGGQAIVLSDGMYRLADFFRALHLLRRRHLEVKFIQVITPQELDPGRLFQGGVLVDAETGTTHQLAYSPAELTQAVRDHNEQLSRFCKRHGIAFAQYRLDEPMETFVFEELPARGFVE